MVNKMLYVMDVIYTLLVLCCVYIGLLLIQSHTAKPSGSYTAKTNFLAWMFSELLDAAGLSPGQRVAYNRQERV